GLSGALSRRHRTQPAAAANGRRRARPQLRRTANHRAVARRSLSRRHPAPGRQRLFFLLNDGLSATAAWEEAAPGQRTPLRMLRVGLLAVIDLTRALGADGEVPMGFDYS